jgi:hypothetical protein
MNSAAEALVSRVGKLEQELTTAKAALRDYRERCQHKWSETRYDPIVRRGYHDPGDGPNWHGADKRFAQYVPEQRTDRWTRECLTCGLVQETKQTAEKVEKVPVF